MTWNQSCSFLKQYPREIRQKFYELVDHVFLVSNYEKQLIRFWEIFSDILKKEPISISRSPKYKLASLGCNETQVS